LAMRVEGIAEDAAAVCTSLGNRKSSKIKDLFVRAAPLNPVAALALAPLFRSRLAQNERSLFAFLAGNEPNGFQEFLRGEVLVAGGGSCTYGVDRLYDYVTNAFGGRLYGPGAREWAKIGEALRRLPSEATEFDARVVKAIGLLGFLGDSTGLGASERLLAI